MILGNEFFVEYNELTKTFNKKAIYDDFAINFLPWHDQGMGPETKDGETALYKDGQYYILNGDWTLAYSELAPHGFDACFSFFKLKAPQFISSWSNVPD